MQQSPAAALFSTGSAVFSEDNAYRYRLDRYWQEEATSPAIFVMLNPSTADANKDDPTIRRCLGFARAWGCSGLTVYNIFALRSTDPKLLRKATDPVGPDNEQTIKDGCAGRIVICAWGTHGEFNGQGDRVLGWLREVGAKPYALRLTAKGQPCHPLYLPADLSPFAMLAAL